MAILTAEDKQLVHRAFMQGPSALLDDGMTLVQAQEFLQRPTVREEICRCDSGSGAYRTDVRS